MACKTRTPAKYRRPQTGAGSRHRHESHPRIDGEPFNAPGKRGDEGTQCHQYRHDWKALAGSYSASHEKRAACGSEDEGQRRRGKAEVREKQIAKQAETRQHQGITGTLRLL
jgi:hypothetical protein